MTRLTINDFSETASDNTDIGGVPITGPSPARNIDDAARATMAIIAKAVSGSTPVNDTWAIRNAEDTTKQARLSAENVPTATVRELDAEALYRQGAVLETPYTASGSHSHTFQEWTRFFQIEAAGGGGGGGGVDGQGTGTGASASGGNSGFCGRTRVLARGSIETGTIEVGTGGAGGAGTGGTNGTNGGNTTWSDGTNSYTWPGGRGGQGMVATSPYGTRAPFLNNDPTGELFGNYEQGDPGAVEAGRVGAPKGGNSPFGTSLHGGFVNSGQAPGTAAIGYGAGGGGAAVAEINSNWPGGDGAGGILIVREW